jgi:diguanylate cyclase (GGDEF)-like protein
MNSLPSTPWLQQRLAQLRGGWSASRLFILLTLAFALAFFGTTTLLAWEQERALSASRRLNDVTLQEIIRYQRLARNIEQLRQQGEHFFAVSSSSERQQAAFVASLVSSHPSMIEHRQAAALAQETETFLATAQAELEKNPQALARWHHNWKTLSERLSLLIDDVTVEGVNLTTTDLQNVTAAMQRAHWGLLTATLLVGVFLALFLLLLHRLLIRPLQAIDTALHHLDTGETPSPGKASPLQEITAVNTAIARLHASLVENKLSRQALEDLANKDDLTGLTNRRRFMLLAEQEMQRAARYQRPVSVAMVDLDCFKRLNDTYGHATGDEVLRRFAQLLRNTLRASDLSCRYGGEEFAFLFPETPLAEAEKLAERIRLACANHTFSSSDGRPLLVTLSLGLSTAEDYKLEAALSRADQALYAAKDAGRNRVQVFSA